jgi:DNA-binding PadR family transcriptional regulator
VKRDNELDLGRFTEPALLILVSLADGPKHGYAMIEDIRRLAGATLGAGTLYGALARLERLGHIEALAARDRRVPYRLTASGRVLLQAHLAGLRRLTAAGMRRLARA